MTYNEKVFPRSKFYDPSRYDTNDSLKDPNILMTWGAGIHLCPGKMFAIYEIKIAVALLL